MSNKNGLLEQIRMIVRDAIDELNEQLDEPIRYEESARLIGKDAVLDSMSFVTLVTTIEELVEDVLDRDIEIVSDRAFSQERSPFATLETLESYVLELLNVEENDDHRSNRIS